MSAVDDIKDRIDISEIISESVKLKKSGKNYTGFCPFHANTRTPAFVVFPETNTWRCFGACNEGGDVFGFLMKKEGWDFPETLSYLAERTGVELKPLSAAQKENEEINAHLRDLLEAAVTYFRHNLLSSQQGKSVLDYLHQRDIADETLEAFEIGYAKSAWEGTRSYLIERGFSEKNMLDAGIVSSREDGGTFDRFRHRIIIPIRDSRGRMCGFGARVVDKQDEPKFLNSPQSIIFDKGRLLYGLDKARKTIRSSNQSVIVEGYMDVIALHQAGFRNAISPMGTALTEHQLRMLKKYSRNIVMALDGDVAGDRATMRGLNVARDALDRQPDPVFNARGLLRHEGRLDADIRIVSLPSGKDPDEVVGLDPEHWKTLIGAAKPIVNYVFDVMAENRDLDDAKVKAEIASQILPLIGDVGNSVEREAYRQQLARRLRVDERALMNWRPKSWKRDSPAEQTRPIENINLHSQKPLQRFCLALLMQNPELLYRIDRQFQALQMERLGARDFSGTEHQIIFATLQKSLAQDKEEPKEYWTKTLDSALLDAAETMSADLNQLAEFVGLELEQPKVADEITARFLQLRKRSLEEDLSKLQFILRSAEEGDGPMDSRSEVDLEGYKTQIQQHAVQKAKLEQALAHRQGSLPNALSAQFR
ncbi:MAG: DNA primase [Chloroflexi bacterium]|nr:DNA primase [Chloroflexota bacterium]